MDEIAEFLKTLRFRKKIFGGVDEKDVWKKLDSLQKEYRSAFDAQEERSQALIHERDLQIVELKKNDPDEKIQRWREWLRKKKRSQTLH